MALTWTKKDSQLATKEGWNLYYSKGSLGGDRQVQRNDEQDLLSEDSDAWVIIKTQELPHHKKALEILKEDNIKEYNRVLKF
jgi:hypothetical protein